MPIDKFFLEQLRSRIDLRQIVAHYVDLKRSGAHYVALCPFHDEKSASFYVYKDHYHCFGCSAHGDAIQFLVQHCHRSFSEAVKQLAAESGMYFDERKTSYAQYSKPIDKPETQKSTSPVWQTKAQELLASCHSLLCHNPALLDKDKLRGLALASIVRFKLGWQPHNLFIDRSSWGLEPITKQDGKQKSLYIPKGLLIPCDDMQGMLTKLKIRRDGWQPKESFPKYLLVEGSQNKPAVFGCNKDVFVLVEAELDAMLVAQQAGTLCAVVATGGASNKPDICLHKMLNDAKIILYALDFDLAGKEAFQWWRRQYPNLHPWPVPEGKSPCDAWSQGKDLAKWIQQGLLHYKIH